jgi:glucan phosphoethanolaminetransferase (alkaline phosphatase superfamily)
LLRKPAGLEWRLLGMNNNLLKIIGKVAGIAVLVILGEHKYKIFDRYEELMHSYGILGGLGFAFFWVISIVALLVSAFLPHLLTRIVLAAVFFGSTWVGLAYTNIIGVSVFTYDNLYVLIENMSFAGDALSHYKKDILYALFIASFAFVFVVSPPDDFKKRFPRIHMPVVAYSLSVFPFLALFAIALLRGGYGLAQTPIQYRIPAMLSMIALEKALYEENVREEVKISPEPVREGRPPNVILVVDESLRGDYIDLNKDQGVTPFLSSIRDRVANFGYASSGANCSAESNQILRYGPNLNDFERTFRTNPFIWQYAKKAGYKTIMIEGQAAKGKLNNRMNGMELSFIDQFMYSEGKYSYEKDMDITKKINTLLSSQGSEPLFILAVKKGLHFPYNDKVPEEKRKFKSKNDGLEIDEKSDLINSYKNAVAYLTDDFFRGLLENKKFDQTVIIYTSDHGQNLLDNGVNMSHCSTDNTSPFEGLIPLLAITGNIAYKEKFDRAVLRNKDKASHFNIYPTILNLFGFQNETIEKRHGKTLFDDITEPRRFLSGLLTINRLNLGSRKETKWNFVPDTLFENEENQRTLVSAR